MAFALKRWLATLVVLVIVAAFITYLLASRQTYGPPPNHRIFNFQTDVFVLIHIQKTGGTNFAGSLLSMRTPNQSHCRHWSGKAISSEFNTTTKGIDYKPGAFSCPHNDSDFPRNWNEVESRESVKSQWLISRLTTGWPCGAHPSLIQLQVCLEELKPAYGAQHFVTILRDPVHRFLSEFLHTITG